MTKNRRMTSQEEADADLAYTISDKRTTNLAEARRLVELEETTASIDEKFASIYRAFESTLRHSPNSPGAAEDQRVALTEALITLNKETRT